MLSVQVCVILECAAEEAMGVSDLDRQIDQLKRRARLFLQLPELSLPLWHYAVRVARTWQSRCIHSCEASLHCSIRSRCEYIKEAEVKAAWQYLSDFEAFDLEEQILRRSSVLL